MVNNLPEWHNAGIEPPNSLKENGWQKEDRPPAQYFNWYMNRSYLALLAAKQHIDNKNNPHGVSKAHIGLNNVVNSLQATKSEFDTHIQSELHTPYGVATGTNNLTLNLNTAPALVAGQTFRFKNSNANTTSVTLRVNDHPAKTILRNGGMQLVAGALRIGGIYTVCYDGANFILQGEGGGGYGNATSSDVIVGRTFGTENGIIDGKMPVINPVTTTLNAGAEFNIPLGFHDGRGNVRATSLASQTAATVAAWQLLAGRTAWVNGGRITGTMPDYSRAALVQSYVEPVGIIVDAAGTLVVEPKTGYYESGKNIYGFGTIRKEEPNLIPANILAGKSIFNVVGTAVAGKRFATGTGWTMAGTNGQLNVTGLVFKPSIVITKLGTNAGQLYGSVHALQTAFSSGASGKLDATIMGGSAANGEFTSLSNGFTVKANLVGEYPVHWIAIE